MIQQQQQQQQQINIYNLAYICLISYELVIVNY